MPITNNPLSIFPWDQACPLNQYAERNPTAERHEGQLWQPAPSPGKIPLSGHYPSQVLQLWENIVALMALSHEVEQESYVCPVKT